MKLGLTLLASAAASAAAFAPAKQMSSGSTALSAFADQLGAQPPLGFFDPLGLVADGDQEKFDRLRYVELKHGRVCMLGFLGQITTRYGIHFDAPFDKEAGTRFEDYPNGLAALFGPNAIPSDRFWEIVLFVGWLELFVMKDVEGTGKFKCSCHYSHGVSVSRIFSQCDQQATNSPVTSVMDSTLVGINSHQKPRLTSALLNLTKAVLQ